jgi:hypothetical protein
MVQLRAARYVTNRQRNTSSVGDMLQHLKWRSLEDRRRDARLVMLYKISHDKVAVSKSDRLSPPLRHSRNMHSQSYQDPLCRTQQRKASFFPRTTVDWNRLPQTTGARCIRKRKKKKKIYIILQESELTCFHFLSRRVKLIVTSERLYIFKKCFHQSKVK